MAKLDEIAVKFTASDAPQVDMETMPEERAGFRATPYPGDYGFMLPSDFDYDERLIDAKDLEGHVVQDAGGAVKKLKRLVVVFDEGHQIKIIRTAPENAEFEGEYLNSYRISNAEYRYGKEKVLVCEMGFLLRALNDSVPKNATNIDWARAIARHPLGKFAATIEWDAYCDTERKRYIWDEGQQKNVEDTKTGCGQRYGQRAYTKADGSKVLMIPKVQQSQADGSVIERFSESISCECGSVVRCFPRLRQYRPFE